MTTFQPYLPLIAEPFSTNASLLRNLIGRRACYVQLLRCRPSQS
jgi:hypothetical protein